MLTREQKERYTSEWIKRKKKKEIHLKEQCELAMKKTLLIAQTLKKNYGAKRVNLFGSLVKNKFWEHSDIDIAVEGITEDRYLDVSWEVLQIAFPFKVDLVLLERIPEKLRKKIEQEGIEI